MKCRRPNEVPPPEVGGEFASAAAEVRIHALRDNETHKLVEAWVNFHIEYFFDLPQNLVAMHIHKGRFFEAGPVVIGSDMTRVDDARIGELWAQVEVTDDERLAVMEDIFGDSEAFYLNIHSTEFPAGVLRGDLQTKEISYLRHLHGNIHFNEFLNLFHGEQSGAEHATVTDKLDLIGDRQKRIMAALGILTRAEAEE